MKIYLVGGAVRDQLLGLPVKERDWVVVGATVKEMLALGYRQVGKEFPVFLHPETNEEYALARMERKTQPGYTGFEFDTSPRVSLEEDLLRRDLTINAMAETADGTLVDPYHGKRDLEQHLLRHVSPAFAEDPVRILRIGRFLARYAHLGFQVAPETITLMQTMVNAGEVNALVAERVWKELERALGEPHPEQFFAVLSQCGAMPILFPTLTYPSQGIHALTVSATHTSNTAIRFAVLLHDHNAIPTLCRRYRVPNAYRELAVLTAAHYQRALQAQHLNADQLLTLFSSLDIFRRKERFEHFVIACQIIAEAHQQPFDARWLNECAQVAQSYDVQLLIAAGLNGQALAVALREKRRECIEFWLKK